MPGTNHGDIFPSSFEVGATGTEYEVSCLNSISYLLITLGLENLTSNFNRRADLLYDVLTAMTNPCS
jgi:hypothetical protein